jgi:rfaE bifunctional protein kinase chain/domain
MSSRQNAANHTSLLALAAKLVDVRVLLVGDLMIDENLVGDVRRISPEAPVPVLDVRKTEARLGGVGNTAANVRALGGHATVIGLVGDDDGHGTVKSLLDAAGVASALVHDSARPTTRKVRLIARGQQIARADFESREPAREACERQLCAEVEARIAEADVLVISDYAKGTITETVAQAAIAAARARGIPSVVDPKHRDLTRYRSATVMTPNTQELELAAGQSFERVESMLKFATEQAVQTNSHILLTRGADGMSLVGGKGEEAYVPALGRAVYDVTGAGDTVVASIALALARNGEWETSMHLASYAAGVVVGKAGTATVTQAELRAAIQSASPGVP